MENPSSFVGSVAVVVLLALVVGMDVLHGAFTTTDLTSAQWPACVAIGSAILWVGEIVKVMMRRRARRRSRTG